MLRLIEPMLSGAEGLLSRCTLTGGSHRTIDPLCLENPRPAGAEPTLTENVASPFQAEPRHLLNPNRYGRAMRRGTFLVPAPWTGSPSCPPPTKRRPARRMNKTATRPAVGPEITDAPAAPTLNLARYERDWYGWRAIRERNKP
jgi:hypothetical protein